MNQLEAIEARLKAATDTGYPCYMLNLSAGNIDDLRDLLGVVLAVVELSKFLERFEWLPDETEAANPGPIREAGKTLDEALAPLLKEVEP